MGTPRTPKYLKHRGPDGRVRARVRINGRDHYLGEYGSAESKAKYRELIGQWSTGDAGTTAAPILFEARNLYLAHIKAKPKTTSTEYCHMRQALAAVDALYPDLPADQFGPKKLRACLEWLAKKYVRRLANRYARRIRSLFSWLVREERIPATVTHALAEVPGLERGEFGVREHKDEVLPVPPRDLWRTLRRMGQRHRAMIRLQVRTGMRPGELCRIKAGDIQREGRAEIRRGVWLTLGRCWLYRPGKHKTQHRGHARFILIGPRAQADLAPYLEHGERPGCFAKGKAPYCVSAYYHAIQRACERAGVAPWHPHQLRHSAASRLAKDFGMEVTRIILGHRSLDVTKIYVLDDLAKAVEVMGQAG